MPKIEQEDRTAAEAWGKVEPDTTQKTDAFAAGHATAREKYQKLLAEERAHADRLAVALIGAVAILPGYETGNRALAVHRKRREGEKRCAGASTSDT